MYEQGVQRLAGDLHRRGLRILLAGTSVEDLCSNAFWMHS